MDNNSSSPSQTPRRTFLKTASKAVATTTLLSGAAHSLNFRPVHAAGSDSINIALIGCGGRGGGAAADALGVVEAPLKLTALADVAEGRTEMVRRILSKQFPEQVDVPDDRMFMGFDAFKQALDTLRPGDIAIFATPAAFRATHFEYAISRGLHVFMEKPVAVDGPSAKRIIDLASKADASKLKVGVGLMCRHCPRRRELFDRLQSGEAGELLAFRAYREHTPAHNLDLFPGVPDDTTELAWQVKRFHNFLWASGGIFSDYYIHNIDEVCWMKNAWPVKAIASGGRHYRGEAVDQNFDVYSIEYTFADGTKLLVDGRTIPGCKREFASFAHGTKGLAVISTASHWPSKARIFEGHNFDNSRLKWEYPQPETQNPYQVEWNDLINAIREDLPYNELESGVMASAVTSMGRMAAHTGQEITLEQFMKHDHEFGPGIENLTLDSPSPLQANAAGKYSIPMPGLVKNREYL